MRQKFILGILTPLELMDVYHHIINLIRSTPQNQIISALAIKKNSGERIRLRLFILNNKVYYFDKGNKRSANPLRLNSYKSITIIT